jgi:hypothetical protein
VNAEPLVSEYLGRLETAAAELDPGRRAELVADLRDHIWQSLAPYEDPDEADVQTVLARIGTPDEIVAAEGVVVPPVPGAVMAAPEAGSPPTRHPLSVEARALLLLTVGAVVLPFLGPVLAFWYVAASDRWTLTQKRTAALIVVVLLAMPAVLLLPMALSGELTWIITTGSFALPLLPLAGFAAAGYLVTSSSLALTITRRP